MQVQKFRWSKVYESQEEELTELLEARKLMATRYVLESFHDSDEAISQDTVLWCADGSVTVIVNGITTFSIQPGDALRLPAGTQIKTTTELFGCVYYTTTG